MNETTRESFWGRLHHDSTPTDRRNQWRYTRFMLAWAVVFVASTFLINFELVTGSPLAWALAFLPSVAGVFVVLAYVRFLREADELQRAIQLHALAIAVCSGFIVWPASQLLGRLGVPLGDLGMTAMVMIVGYIVGTLHGRRRYL